MKPHKQIDIEKICLFDGHPTPSERRLAQLEAKGLITPATSLHDGDRRTAQVTNPTGGLVVGYTLLADALKNGKVTQQDARDLLTLEVSQTNGRPRASHTGRLLVVAFAEDKGAIHARIDAHRRAVYGGK